MHTSRIKELKEVVAELGIEASFTTLDDEYPRDDWAKEKYAVLARLEYQERAIEFPYFYGHFSLAGSDEFPSVADLVWTMCTESEGVTGNSFQQWCDEFGYDSDSISQLKTYEACKVRAVEWSEFIDDSEIEQDLRESGWEY